ncbi:MAG: translocation/assembly module TamB domain-containing protein [Allosphingosinicella sp.]|uniref:translocation/assembly module TamB domain-containing protein n=1 Tax=Allosphingosinicella sp. TaxID=2823234 RepID=UPI00392C5002
MAEQALDADAAPAEADVVRVRRGPGYWAAGLLKALVALALALILLVGAFVVVLDTGIGHRFILDRIAAVAPESGLRIRVGRIEGSIWGRTGLRDVRLYDPEGLFAEAPLIELDWRPYALVANRLLIHEAQSDLVILHRLPELIPAEEPGPILPEMDIRIDRLAVAQIRIEEAVTGERRAGSLAGEIDIRKGRALVDLQAELRDGGDRLALRMDAEPDRDRFDLEVQLRAPANSLLGTLAGTRRPIRLDVTGDGSWTRWAGTARMELSGQRVADLQLTMNEGRYRAAGALQVSQLLQGKLQRLTAPRILMNAQGRFADRRFDGTISARSAALRVETRGGFSLGRAGFDDFRIAAELLRPPALFTNMTGRQVRLTALLDGAPARARFVYRLTAPRIAFDDTGFEEVRAEGAGRLSRWPVTVPIRVTAARVTGVGDVAGGILRNLDVAGPLLLTPRRLSGEGLVLRSDRLQGRLGLLVDLRTGEYAVAVSGGMQRYAIPGLGIVDVQSDLRAVPGPGGRGTVVTGTGRAFVRRLDNEFLLWLGGGLPQLETGIVRGTDGIIRFENLRIAAPSLRLAGSGLRRRDGTFQFEGGGAHGEYGPVRLSLDGDISRPRMAIRLPRPLDALGLADVLLNLDPSAEGFAWRAEGGSMLGPFAGRGAILLPAGAPATIEVANLAVSGTNARGALRSVDGGFAGRLDVSGGGVSGHLGFAPLAGVQRIEADLAAVDARFLGDPPLAIRAGRLRGALLLDPAGASIEAQLAARGVSRGGLSIANVTAQASLRGGAGQVRAEIAGSRGRDFSFATIADVAPGRMRLTGRGTVDRRPIELTAPALLTREGDDWRLAPASLRFAGGSATVGGLFGANRTEFDARLDAMPLTVMDVFYPRLGLGGIASGTLSYRAPTGGAAPAGDMNLRVRGLTRAGLVLASRPVDVGIAARLQGANAAMRAIAVSEGRTIGRAQARLAPVPLDGGDLFDRLSRAPLFGQLRYNGPADTLWRLTGVELLDLSGPAAVGADVTGTLSDPRIRGSVRTDQARLESAVTGMVVENIRSAGRFDGSRLVMDQFQGTTARGGTVSARGVFDLAAARGFGMDLRVDANAAQLLDRDDIRAQVTGPLTIRSDGEGGTIGGDVTLVSGAFRLGSATSAAQVPRLPVRELNRPDQDIAPLVRRVAPWRLALNVSAPRNMQVTGLGMTSEWGADVRIAGTVTEPRITGNAELIRGSYDFAGRRFDLTRGTIRFQGESPINPVLDILAEGGARGLNAQIRVTGRGQAPEIAFTSTPALPQDELLSRLLFGTSITNLTAPEALQLAAAVASLNDPSGGLNPINAVRQAVGLDRLRILPADVTQGTGTALAAGKYLGRRVYVEVVTDARGYSATIVEYQITRWLSLLSSISTIGRESVNLRVSRDY